MLLGRNKKNTSPKSNPAPSINTDEGLDIFSGFEFSSINISSSSASEDEDAEYDQIISNPADETNTGSKLEEIRKRGLNKLAAGKITSPDPEVMVALSMDSDELNAAFNKMAETYLATKKDKNSQKAALMKLLLGFLRAAHWLHWTSHWQVQGSTFYSDHKLLKKLYEGVTDEIDTLAEKIVGEFGSSEVNPLEQSYFLMGFVNDVCSAQQDPIHRAYLVEKSLQQILKVTYDKVKKLGNLSLGLDDYLMATANNHETYLYLLSQRNKKS